MDINRITDPGQRYKFVKIPAILKRWIESQVLIENAKILDFGCGQGDTTFGVSSLLNPRKVIGIDIKDSFKVGIKRYLSVLELEKKPENIEFFTVDQNHRPDFLTDFDCIFSWSVLEHVYQDYLDQTILDMHRMLKPHGVLFVQISPLYYSPFGSHMESVIDTPWAHLLWQQEKIYQSVMSVQHSNRPGYESGDSLERLKRNVWQTYGTLNRITADELIALHQRSGFRLVRHHRTETSHEPPTNLQKIYTYEILKTEAIYALFQKEG